MRRPWASAGVASISASCRARGVSGSMSLLWWRLTGLARHLAVHSVGRLRGLRQSRRGSRWRHRTIASDRFDLGSFVLARVQPEPCEHESSVASHPANAAKQGSWALNEQRESTTDTATSASGSTCEVSERWVDEVAIVAASGVVDMLTAPQLEDGPAGRAREEARGHLVVDLTDVEFLASAGMGVLVAAHDEAGDGHPTLRRRRGTGHQSAPETGRNRRHRAAVRHPRRSACISSQLDTLTSALRPGTHQLS